MLVAPITIGPGLTTTTVRSIAIVSIVTDALGHITGVGPAVRVEWTASNLPPLAELIRTAGGAHG
jgi:hypothetical protein